LKKRHEKGFSKSGEFPRRHNGYRKGLPLKVLVQREERGILLRRSNAGRQLFREWAEASGERGSGRSLSMREEGGKGKDPQRYKYKVSLAK